jgi:all-trans-8'-apo-beta-carotenal 15,15'-oxygenase
MKFHRRDFFRLAPSAAFLLSLSPARLQARENIRLSVRGNRATDLEGQWKLSDIEGEIPKDLRGSFYKIGPGTKDLFGTKLKHYFDGDGYVSRYAFTDDGVELTTRFIQTPQRMEEQSTGKMLYDEFGTAAPKANRQGRKNQPNISLFPWKNDLLALSEGGHPAALDPETLEFRRLSNFNGTLPKNVSFSAHPKVDPRTGEAFGFGIEQGISKALKVYKLDQASGTCEELYSLGQKHVFMIHDMTLTDSHIIFLIPPVYFKITDIIFAQGSLAEAIKFDPKIGSRLVVLDRKGKEKPCEIKLPPGLVFHHGNAMVSGYELKLQTFLSQDDSIMRFISDWDGPLRNRVNFPQLHEMTFNLKSKKLLKDEVLLSEHDFPVFNPRFTGQENRYLYMTGMGPETDPFGLHRVTKFDLKTRISLTHTVPEGQLCGEPFFVERPHAQAEDDGWIAFTGHDESRDEAFLEIRDARDLSFVARAWAGIYIPLGFHGTFLAHDHFAPARGQFASKSTVISKT